MALTIYSQSASPLGTTIYRFTGIVAPAQFVPTLTVTTSRNRTGTNVMYKAVVDYPLITTVDGVTLAPNHFKFNFEFTALQSVENNSERERVLDEVIAFLTAHRDEITAGSARPIV